MEYSWETLASGTLGGAIIGLAFGALAVYARFRSVLTAARSADADFQAKEDARIIDYWKALMAERTEQYRIAMVAVESKLRTLEEGEEKRNQAHIECQIQSAKQSVEILHLKERVAVLEKGGHV